MKSLKTLNLSGCSNLEKFPEISDVMKELSELYLDETAIKEVPTSIENLKGLVNLNLKGCRYLENLPSSICQLKSLRYVTLSGCSKFELFTEIVEDMGGLRELHLDGTSIKELSPTMNQLHHLTVLKLEGCKRLKSIPELSSSINFTDAHNCTSLETVSSPKPPYTNHCFIFSNCLQLVNNPFRDVVETHLNYQGNYMRPLSFSMSLPGSEIPEWFNHQSIGSSVTVKLPLNLFDNKFLGFGICGITSFKGSHYASRLSAQCFCTFIGNHSNYSFSFYLVDWGFTTDRFLKSDHMFLGYVPWSEYRLIKKGEPVKQRYYTEAKFNIVMKNEVNVHDITATAVAAVQHPCIKRSGVRFLCSNHDLCTLWREAANSRRSFKGCSYNEVELSEITYDEENYSESLEHFGGTKENSREYASDDDQGELSSSEIIDGTEPC